MISRKKYKVHRPCLYCGVSISEDDREATELLREAGIPFLSLGPEAEIKTPYIEYGRYHQWIFFGLREIRLFIKRWQQNELPSFEPD